MKTIILHLLATVIVCGLSTLTHRLPHPPPFEWAEYLVTTAALSAIVLAAAFFMSLFNKLSQRKYLFLHMIRHLLAVMIVVVVLGDWLVPLLQVFDSYALYFYVELIVSVLVLFWVFDSTGRLMFPRVRRLAIHLVSGTVIVLFLFLEFRHQLLPSSQSIEEMPDSLALIEPLLPWHFATVTPEEYFVALKKNADEIQDEIAEDLQADQGDQDEAED